MPSSATYLITSPSGNIGQHLVPLLLSRESKPTLVLLTSNAERVRSRLPVSEGEKEEEDAKSRVKIAEGDIQDPVFVEATARRYGATAAFVCLSHANELMVTLNFFDALQRSQSVKHVVYLSACGDFTLDKGLQQQQQQQAGDNNKKGLGALRKNSAANVVVKYILEAKLRHGIPARDDEDEKEKEKGGFSWTILGPTLFFGNDYGSKQSLLENAFYDQPLGETKGVSRVDEKDIALAAANALEDDGKVWHGKKVMVGTLQTYTGAETARLWSRALSASAAAGAEGKEEAKVTAALNDRAGLDAVEKKFRDHIDPMWGRDLSLMLEYFSTEGFGMTRDEYEEQVALLGRQPSSYEEFVMKTAEEWKNA